ncbi:MAG: Hpt domain-containing protein [Pseudomonadota bacterium]|nr:Hpt domain-containing protein [Pseudomonadota bacterium]
MNKIKVDSELKDIMPEFLLFMKKEIGIIDEAFRRQDLPAILSFAHRLRGDAPGYSLSELGSLGSQMEEECKSGNLPAGYNIFEKIKNYLQNLEIEFV